MENIVKHSFVTLSIYNLYYQIYQILLYTIGLVLVSKDRRISSRVDGWLVESTIVSTVVVAIVVGIVARVGWIVAGIVARIVVARSKERVSIVTKSKEFLLN